MTPRQDSQRQPIVDLAFELFTRQGYEGTSLRQISNGLGLTPAAVYYHFRSKDLLLHELVDPLLSELEAVVDRHPAQPTGTAQVRALLSDYLDTLIRHHARAVWLDADLALLAHAEIGPRLQRNLAQVELALAGRLGSQADRIRASATVGILWRPLRYHTALDIAASHDDLIDSAMAGHAHVPR